MILDGQFYRISISTNVMKRTKRNNKQPYTTANSCVKNYYKIYNCKTRYFSHSLSKAYLKKILRNYLATRSGSLKFPEQYDNNQLE